MLGDASIARAHSSSIIQNPTSSCTYADSVAQKSCRSRYNATARERLGINKTVLLIMLPGASQQCDQHDHRHPARPSPRAPPPRKNPHAPSPAWHSRRRLRRGTAASALVSSRVATHW
jgi:hypothetical protein